MRPSIGVATGDAYQPAPARPRAPEAQLDSLGV
jgi:hypothetical protein